MTLSSLYGAVAMNNLLSLGIFIFMIYFLKLEWNFQSETMSVIVVVLCIGTLGVSSPTIRVFHTIWILFLYPFSILLVYILTHYAGWE